MIENDTELDPSASQPGVPASDSRDGGTRGSARLERAIGAASTASAHADRLRERKDGPYYIAPDSVEPSPSGMWSSLDPSTVERVAETFPRVQSVERDPQNGAVTSVPVPKPQREILEAGGDAAHHLLATLQQGL